MQPQVMVLATTNQGKTREIQTLLKGFPVRIRNLDEFGPIPPVVEDGETFDENAYKKAAFTARVLGLPAMADDSGICVEALGGEPGIRSARFAGETATDAENLQKLLDGLNGKADRRAAFKCVISIAVPSGAALTYEGECNGLIAGAPRGNNGFGYDPVFYFPDLDKTFAQMSIAEKACVSHRGKALEQVRDEFDNILAWIDIQTPQREIRGCKKDKFAFQGIGPACGAKGEKGE